MKEINIPENATNGEVLGILFPHMRYTLSDSSSRVITSFFGIFEVDWWNAPYKTESDKESEEK